MPKYAGTEMARELGINQPFNLELSLTMGQAFRWRCLEDGWFSGVVGPHLFHVRQIDGVNGPVEYRVGGASGERDADEKYDDLLLRYFREDDDVTAIYGDISRDTVVAGLVRQYPGMRVLRQEPWECLVSYICSKSNSIPNIRKCVGEIVKLSCQTVKLSGDERYIFPTHTRLLEVGEPGLRSLNLAGRFRADFPWAIVAAAKRVQNGDLDLHQLRGRPYAEVIPTLMQGRPANKETNGIGQKIADCVALMSLDKLEAFPVDGHIKKAVRSNYLKGAKLAYDPTTVRWAQDHFGLYVGYAGQYLFHAQPKRGLK